MSRDSTHLLVWGRAGIVFAGCGIEGDTPLPGVAQPNCMSHCGGVAGCTADGGGRPRLWRAWR